MDKPIFIGADNIRWAAIIPPIEFDPEDPPTYLKDIYIPISANAEMEFECTLDAMAFPKLVGCDLSGGSDCTVIFKGLYKTQIRTHKKKRINKKWTKRYGYRTTMKSHQMENVYINKHSLDEYEIIGDSIKYIY